MPVRRDPTLIHALSAFFGTAAAVVVAAALWLTSSHPADVVLAITATPSHTPTITPTITPGGPTLTPTPIGPHVALDLNISNGAGPCDIIDATATAVTGTQVQVAVCAQEFSSTVRLFEYRVQYDDSKIVAPEVANVGQGLDDNPDANGGATTFSANPLGPEWHCQFGGVSYPAGDTNPASGAGNGDAFSGGCSDNAAPFDYVPDGALGVITFDVFTPGTATLNLHAVSIIHPSLNEVGSCEPTVDKAIPCFDGQLIITGAPLPTFTPIITSSATPGATSTPSPLTTGVYLDMDPGNGSAPCAIIDPSVNVPVGSTAAVAVCQVNAEDDIAAFQYNVLYDDTIVVAPEQPNVGLGLDDNPDSNAGATTFGATNLGPSWDCTGSVGAYPEGDNNPATGANNGRAYSGGCSSVSGPYTLGPSGVVQVITFQALQLGSSPLTFNAASFTQNDLNEMGSCDPVVDRPMACVGGTINVVPPLPTSTPTATNTATPTLTPTPTPAGPTVNKSPTSANLFLCEVGPCAGPGEGDVVISEVVTNVTEPLGAWEIQIKFDHKVFNVEIDPNEALFTGFGRTPTCNIQVVTENWILFSCVSTGPVGAGFTGGPAVLATVTLTPNEDLRFRLHPGNDNGVVRMILDENCEVANTLGHPQPGSVNGGLAVECGDASITVRILEGDLNLDCEVDVLDQQLIASRYGTFFGNIFYDPWYDLEPALKDFDIDIKDLQKVFGRDGSTCANPSPAQPPAEGLSVGPL